MNLEIKDMVVIGGIVFAAGGGWLQLSAVADDAKELDEKVEEVEDKQAKMDTDIALIRDSVEDTEKEVEENAKKLDSITTILQSIQQSIVKP